MTSESNDELQRDAFLLGEGDQWFRRNPFDKETSLQDPWNVKLAATIGRDSSVLEIGCSDGRRLWAISKIASCSGTLVGVDPSSEAVGIGGKRFPNLDLRVETADQTGVEGEFDLVLVGFCLYLCDRHLLFKAVAEIDRLVKDGGLLAIIDFYPPEPLARRYHHIEGLWSYKCDYPSLFLSSPAYQLVSQELSGSDSPRGERSADSVGLSVLRKELLKAYRLEMLEE